MDRLISNDFSRQALRKESYCVKVSWRSRKPIPSFSATVQVVFCYSKSECSQSSHHMWLPSRRHETLYKFPCVQSWHATSQPMSSPWQMRTKCSWVRWRKEGEQQKPGAAEVLSAEAGDAEAFLEEEGLPPPSLRVRDKPVICMWQQPCTTQPPVSWAFFWVPLAITAY